MIASGLQWAELAARQLARLPFPFTPFPVEQQQQKHPNSARRRVNQIDFAILCSKFERDDGICWAMKRQQGAWGVVSLRSPLSTATTTTASVDCRSAFGHWQFSKRLKGVHSESFLRHTLSRPNVHLPIGPLGSTLQFATFKSKHKMSHNWPQHENTNLHSFNIHRVGYVQLVRVLDRVLPGTEIERGVKKEYKKYIVLLQVELKIG